LERSGVGHVDFRQGRAVEEVLNFTQLSALIVDSDRYSQGIVTQILRGFGLTRLSVASTGADAKNYLLSSHLDLVITESVLPDMRAADLVRWIRKLTNPTIKYVPVVMLTGYAQFSIVAAARDSGANSFVRKPVAPAVLFDHIAWSAKMDRPFIEADGYTGPCRRFKFGEPAPGRNRRKTDHQDDEPQDAQSDSPELQKEPVTS
jgi:two-component system, chemotaxis family, chemotaxis protein CheY